MNIVGETRSGAEVVLVVSKKKVGRTALYSFCFINLCSAKCRGSMMGKHIPSGVG